MFISNKLLVLLWNRVLTASDISIIERPKNNNFFLSISDSILGCYNSNRFERDITDGSSYWFYAVPVHVLAILIL